MAAFGWREQESLEKWLFAEPWKFDFFQAVRLLERLKPDAMPLAEGSDPGFEAVRFIARVGLEFSSSEIQDLRPAPGSGDAPLMTVNFMGLAGLQGPLPRADTERILERLRQKDTAFRDFLDIFNHRLVSLTVRARKAHLPALSSHEPHRTPLANYLRSFFGAGLQSLQNRMHVSERLLLHYTGILSQRPRSASGLERMLADYFRVPVKIVQMVGHWRELEPEQCSRIGLAGQNQELGSATLGKRYWDQQARIQVELGPLHFPMFEELLPCGKGYRPLCELTRFYVGSEYQFSFRLVLAAKEIPPARLGQARLRWTSWLKTRPSTTDDSQVQI
jgi:type VI secretion system protein ImpH